MNIYKWFSNKFLKKLNELGTLNYILKEQFGEAQIIFQPLRSGTPFDVREVLKLTPMQTAELKNILWSRIISENDSEPQKVLKIAEFVNKHLTYVSDKNNPNFMKIEYWADPYTTFKIKKDDCLTFDTPIVVYNKGYANIIEVSELIPEETKDNIQTKTKYRVLTGITKENKTKFKYPNWVIKKKTTKNIYRLNTGKSVIDVTEDHPIMYKEGTRNKFITAKGFTKKRLKIIKNFYKSFKNKGHDYGFGYVYGLFSAEGYCNKKTSWRIYNTDLSYLEKAKKILESKRWYKLRNLKFDIKTYNSFKKGAYTNFGQRNKTLYVLKPNSKRRGSLTKFCNKWYDDVYTKNHNKKVPYFILNGSKECKQGFLDGHYDGDKFCSVSKILMFGLTTLHTIIGKRCNIKDNKKNFVLITKFTEKGNIKKIRTTKNIGKTNKYVYDLNFDEPHVFCAGDTIVHNCDGYACLIMKLMELADIPAEKRYVMKCRVDEGWHASILYFLEDYLDWFVIEGSYRSKLVLNDFGVKPYRYQEQYHEVEWFFNETKSYAKSREIFEYELKDVENAWTTKYPYWATSKGEKTK